MSHVEQADKCAGALCGVSLRGLVLVGGMAAGRNSAAREEVRMLWDVHRRRQELELPYLVRGRAAGPATTGMAGQGRSFVAPRSDKAQSRHG